LLSMMWESALAASVSTSKSGSSIATSATHFTGSSGSGVLQPGAAGVKGLPSCSYALCRLFYNSLQGIKNVNRWLTHFELLLSQLCRAQFVFGRMLRCPASSYLCPICPPRSHVPVVPQLETVQLLLWGSLLASPGLTASSWYVASVSEPHCTLRIRSHLQIFFAQSQEDGLLFGTLTSIKCRQMM
jgi:hypothetical protein